MSLAQQRTEIQTVMATKQHRRHQPTRIHHNLQAKESLTNPRQRRTARAIAVERKQILRLMIEQVTVAVQNRSQSTTVTIRWSGGYESCHGIERPIQTYAQLDNYQELIDRALSLTLSGMRSPMVASILTQEGFRTPRNQEPLSGDMVSKILNDDARAKKQLHGPELLQDHWYTSSLAAQIE